MPAKKGSKLNKQKRGGPKFIQNAEEMELRDERVEAADKVKKERRKARKLADGDEVSSSSSDEDGGFSDMEDEAEEEKKPKKKGGVAGLLGDFETANPNAVNKSLQTMKIGAMKDFDAGDGTGGLSRKEKEILDAEKAKRAYERKHAAGETVEAKADLKRLQEVKARRAAQAKAKEAEEAAGGGAGAAASAADEVASKEAAKRAAAMGEDSIFEAAKEDGKKKSSKKKGGKKKEEAAGGGGGGGRGAGAGTEKLEPRDIKKMKPPQMKEALKERGLAIDGNKKVLEARLIEACKEE